MKTALIVIVALIIILTISIIPSGRALDIIQGACVGFVAGVIAEKIVSLFYD